MPTSKNSARGEVGSMLAGVMNQITSGRRVTAKY